jgi:hypothetical protein
MLHSFEPLIAKYFLQAEFSAHFCIYILKNIYYETQRISTSKIDSAGYCDAFAL